MAAADGLRDTREELIERVSTVPAEDVHRVAVEAMYTALLMVPRGTRADWGGFVAVPTMSTHHPRDRQDP